MYALGLTVREVASQSRRAQRGWWFDGGIVFGVVFVMVVMVVVMVVMVVMVAMVVMVVMVVVIKEVVEVVVVVVVVAVMVVMVVEEEVVVVVVMGACESMRLLQQMECPGLIPSPPFPTATATTATAPIRGGSVDGVRCRVRTCACFGRSSYGLVSAMSVATHFL